MLSSSAPPRAFDPVSSPLPNTTAQQAVGPQADAAVAMRLARRAFDRLMPEMCRGAFLDVNVQGLWWRVCSTHEEGAIDALLATPTPARDQAERTSALSPFWATAVPIVRHLRRAPQAPELPHEAGCAQPTLGPHAIWPHLLCLPLNTMPQADHTLALPLATPSRHVLAVAVLLGVPAQLTQHAPELGPIQRLLGHTLALMEPHLWSHALRQSEARSQRLEAGRQLLRRATTQFNACTTQSKIAHTLGRMLLELSPEVEAAAVRIKPLHNQHGCSALCHRHAETQELWRAGAWGQRPALTDTPGPSLPPVPLQARGSTIGDVRIWCTHAPTDAGDRAPASDASDASNESVDAQLYPLPDLVQLASDAIERVLLQEEAALSATLRENFLSVASHELRTPLTALNLQLENLSRLVRRHCDRAVVDKLSEKMARAFRQTGRLAQLLDNLLDVVTLRSGTLHVATTLTQVKDFLRTALVGWAHEAHKAGCVLTVHCPDEISGMWDGYRMAQVLDHILANAIKYGAGRPIDLTVDHTDTEILLTLKDCGIGVPPEVSERIFGAFERAVSPREFGGLGLGLFLSRSIVEAHGGRMHVTPSNSCGAQFHIALPKASGTLKAP